jgi:SAM-dependent methyltransferase
LPGLTRIALDRLDRDSIDLVADAGQLPIAAAAVDLVAAFQMLQYAADPLAMLGEFRRVLSGGGHMVLSYPFLYGETDATDRWRWSEAGMCHLLSKAGFEIVASRRIGGPLFCGVSAAAEALIDLIPGNRRLVTPRTPGGAARLVVITMLTLPLQGLQWIALALDRVFPRPRRYVGGLVLARRRGDD